MITSIFKIRKLLLYKNELTSKTQKYLSLKIPVLTAGISQALKGADDNEQYSRRYCLRIKGIDKEKDETGTKCIDKVITVCKHIKVDIIKNDIDRAHRVGKDRPTMIVKFFSFLKRTYVYKARKNSDKNKIHLDITKKRLSLLDKAKKHIRGFHCRFCFR